MCGHRGVPGAPGRVVTLKHCPGARCWGVAYLLAGTYEEQQKTLKVRHMPHACEYSIHVMPHAVGMSGVL